MDISKINSIEPIDSYYIRKVLTSSELTDIQKTQFLKNNSTQIKQTLQNEEISCSEFKELMKNRPIIKFRPLKNSFTKRGDKILLAKTLGILPANVEEYLRNVTEDLKSTKDLDFLPESTVKKVQTYIYRHGSKEQVVVFLDTELKKSKDVLNTLYSTLQYNTGGIADYFVRPIHRMDNHTLKNIYNVIDDNLNIAEKSGQISKENKDLVSKWAIIQVYKIQQNSKLINAIKSQEVLS